jgi:ribosomal protein S20
MLATNNEHEKRMEELGSQRLANRYAKNRIKNSERNLLRDWRENNQDDSSSDAVQNLRRHRDSVRMKRSSREWRENPQAGPSGGLVRHGFDLEHTPQKRKIIRRV